MIIKNIMGTSNSGKTSEMLKEIGENCCIISSEILSEDVLEILISRDIGITPDDLIKLEPTFINGRFSQEILNHLLHKGIKILLVDDNSFNISKINNSLELIKKCGIEKIVYTTQLNYKYAD